MNSVSVVPGGEAQPGTAVKVAHLAAALFIGLFLFVPDTNTSLSALACLAAVVAGARGWVANARRNLVWMGVFVWPALIFLATMAVDVAADRASSKIPLHVGMGLLCLWVGLSGVPGRLADLRRWFLPAAALGAFGTLGLGSWQVFVEGAPRAYGLLGWGTLWSGAVKFGAMAALQGLLALLLFIGINRHAEGRDRVLRYLGLAGFLASTATIGLTQARGALLGFVLGLVAIGWTTWRAPLRRGAGEATDGVADPHRGPAPARDHHRLGRRSRRTTAAVAALAIVALGLAAGAMSSRLADIPPQLERYRQGDAVSEIGQRLALWATAQRAIEHSPWVGTGFGRFRQEIKRQHQAGEVPEGIELLYGQTHNEYLSSLVDGGIIAGLATLVMFVLPPIVLLRRLRRHADRGMAGRAALAVSIAFAAFALTDNIFDRQLSTLTFYFLISWLLSAAVPSWTAARRPG